MNASSSWIATVVESIKEVLGKGLGYHDTASKIREAFPEAGEGPELALIKALDYHAVPRLAADDSGLNVYSPMIEMAGRVYPERVDAAAKETLHAWSEAFELFGDYPLVVARVGDLLWLRRYGDTPYKYAHAALTAMRSLWSYSGMKEVYQADNLVRALDLACELGDQSLIAGISKDMVTAAKASLQRPDWAPGVQMRLIERLVALPRRRRPAGLDELLDLAADVFENDPFQFAAVTKCQLQLNGDDQEARRATARRMVRSWKSAAEKAEPLVAQKHLEQALEIAVAEGLGPEEIDSLRVQMQATLVRDSDLTTVTTEVGISGDAVREILDHILEGGDPSRWLVRLGAYCPVQKDRSAVEAFVQTLIQQNAFLSMASTSVLNADGLPVKFISPEDDESFTYAVRKHDEQNIVIWGCLAELALQQACANGQLTEVHVVAHLSESIFGAELAAGIGRAFNHYVAGQFEEALFCCLPRIEAGIRAVSMALGLTVFMDPGSSRTGVGGYKALGELLEGLDGMVPEHHRRYLQLLLANPLSINLRNRAFHGLMQEVSRQDAALVLHAALLIGLWRASSAAPTTSDEADS